MNALTVSPQKMSRWSLRTKLALGLVGAMGCATAGGRSGEGVTGGRDAEEAGSWHQAVVLHEEGAADGLDPCGL